MWFQTLKAKQGIRHFITSNSKGQAAAIEYNDKKVEVHLLKREAMPLLLDEGCHVAFLSHKSSAMTLVSLSLSLKNSKVQLDFKTWDMMGVLGFTPKDILVEDMSKCYVSDGKFKGAVTLPEQHCSPSSTIKVDSCGVYLAVAIDISLVLLWKVKKADVSTITMTLEGVLKSQMAIHSLCLLPEPTNNQVQVLIGEAGGVRIWSVVKDTQDEDEVKTEMCHSSFVSLPQVDPGGSSVIQDLQRYSSTRCILSDMTGRLWALNLTPPGIIELQLPSSLTGHGLFAVQGNSDSNNNSDLMVVVEKGHTLNLFDLKNLSQSSSTVQPISLIPYHTIFSSITATSVAFFQPSVLAAGSVANKSFMMWVGTDMCPGNNR